MKKLVLFSVVFLSLNLNAVDQFNSYRFNRKNVINNNGKVDTTPWFEWWYYKVVLPKEGRSFYFVYGVVNPWDQFQVNPASRSVISMGDFERKVIYEEVDHPTKFKASYDSVYASIGDSVATDKRFYGKSEASSWDVTIEKLWTFNATGWATGKGITDIEWYPAQASAKCSGTITSGEESYSFKDAPCYQDRNWGKSFPKWWTWIVSNQFENSPGTAIAIGGGWPAIKGRYTPVKGVAIGLWYKGKEYSFRPNDLDRVGHEITFGKWKTWAQDGRTAILVEASAPKSSFMDLQFMAPDGALFHDYETLSGQISLKIYNYRRGKWELIDDLHSNWGGIEYGSEKIYDLESLFFDDIMSWSNLP